jgi:hypothetical protein
MIDSTEKHMCNRSSSDTPRCLNAVQGLGIDWMVRGGRQKGYGFFCGGRDDVTRVEHIGFDEGGYVETQDTNPFAFKFGLDGISASLYVSDSDPARRLEEEFNNSTLKVLLAVQQWRNGSIRASDGKKVFHYKSFTLIVTYLVTFIAALLMGAHGLYSTLTHSPRMGKDISYLILATRNKALHDTTLAGEKAFWLQRLKFGPGGKMHVVNNSNALEVIAKTLPCSTDSTSVAIARKTPSNTFPNPDPNSTITLALSSDSLGRILICISFVLATILTGGHHAFLAGHDGTLVLDFPQFRVTNTSNAFSQLVVLLLKLGMTVCLTQMVCIMSICLI